MRVRKSILLLIFILAIGILDVTAQEPVTHTIKISSEFTPSTLNVDIGDRVIFEWTEEANYHNVAQTLNSETFSYKESGFRSGDPRDGPFSWELPQEFMDRDVTLFYLCEPHSESMRGKIIVGNGSPEEKLAPGFLIYGMIIPTGLIILMRKKTV